VKLQDVEKVQRELQQFSGSAAEIDTAYVRADGNGYQMRLQWAGRVAKVGSLAQWISVKQAWNALNERR
jgi:hypothetical protein